jgi:hypothetical protein
MAQDIGPEFKSQYRKKSFCFFFNYSVCIGEVLFFVFFCDTWSFYVIQAGLKLEILLSPKPPELWDCRGSPHAQLREVFLYN